MLAESAKTPLHWLVVDAGAITNVDFTAARVVCEVVQDLLTRGHRSGFCARAIGLEAGS